MTVERLEMEAEQAGREDYLYEAYGSEAAMLADQMQDDIAQAAGFTGHAVMAREARRWNSKRRAALAIANSKSCNRGEDIPF
jgi:hypothetical protein